MEINHENISFVIINNSHSKNAPNLLNVLFFHSSKAINADDDMKKETILFVPFTVVPRKWLQLHRSDANVGCARRKQSNIIRIERLRLPILFVTIV